MIYEYIPGLWPEPVTLEGVGPAVVKVDSPGPSVVLVGRFPQLQSNVAVVPEPAVWVTLVVGIVLVAWWKRRWK